MLRCLCPPSSHCAPPSRCFFAFFPSATPPLCHPSQFLHSSSRGLSCAMETVFVPGLPANGALLLCLWCCSAAAASMPFSFLFLTQNPAIPAGRIFAFCGSHGPRHYCWGGFSTTTSSYLTDAAVFWPGIPVVEISQTLPPALTSSSPGSGDSLDGSQVLVEVQQSLVAMRRQNIQCTLKFNADCG